MNIFLFPFGKSLHGQANCWLWHTGINLEDYPGTAGFSPRSGGVVVGLFAIISQLTARAAAGINFPILGNVMFARPF
jgi:hypothetical protein